MNKLVKCRAVLALGAAFLAAAQLPARAADFFLRDGESPIVFLGDSITEQRMYTTLIESYILTRFPYWKVTFRNAGWGGDTAYLARRGNFESGLQRDVLSLRPAVVTVDFGMNDLRGGEPNLDKFEQNSTRLVEQLKASGARVVLISPSPEERSEAGQPGGSAYNLMLAKGTAVLKKIAATARVPFVDQHTPFVHAIDEGRAAGVLSATAFPRLTNDSIHPNWAGHLIMADSILKGLGAPAEVSSVEIDGAKGSAGATLGCTVAGLSVAAGTVSFTRTDDILPLPIPPAALPALKIPGVTPLEDLSRYMLKVTGLAAPRYAVSVDGKQAAVLTREELAAGANLSLRAGAVTEQANAVLAAVTAKNDLYFHRWREIQLFEIPGWLQTPESEARRRAELEKTDAEIGEKEKQIDALRQSVPHKWVLTPLS